MRQQRNIFETKELDKTPEEEVSRVEINNQLNKEFKKIIMKMLNKLGRIINKQ